MTMITIKQIRGTRDYFKNYLSQNEYYSEGEKVAGCWHGKLAEMLGIEGHEVTAENFGALGNNRHPVTGEKLRPRIAKVRFHDVVVSAPKSYSVAALVGQDERLIEGFQRSVEKAFCRLEKCIAVRDRAGSAYHTENFLTTGNAAAALFRHDDNRLLDPQLHMHVVFSNHSFSAERDGYLALQPKIMMDEAKRWITDQFHRDLGEEARKAGYQVEFIDNRLRLPEVGLKIEYKFSKRTQQRRGFERRYRRLFGEKPDKKRIEHFIKEGKAAAERRFTNEYQGRFGREPSQKMVEEFVVGLRTQKKVDTGDAEKLRYQRGQLNETEAKKLDRIVARARQQDQAQQVHSLSDEQGEKVNSNGGPECAEIIKKREGKSQGKESRSRISPKTNVVRSQARKNSVGRMEAIRRMRRGMEIARALQGSPAGLLARQLTILAKRKNQYEKR